MCLLALEKTRVLFDSLTATLTLNTLLLNGKINRKKPKVD